MLYFGSGLSRSLLNQNQIRNHIRHHNGRVQDDYTREDEEFGILTHDTFIPFAIDGSTIYFESRVPSATELENLPHVVITSRERWDPHSTPLVRPHAAEISRTHTSNIHEATWDVSPSDITARILWDMSPIIDEPTLRERVIKSIRVTDNYLPEPSHPVDSRNRSIHAITAQHRHTKVTAETLSRMWNIGLAAWTSAFTTPNRGARTRTTASSAKLGSLKPAGGREWPITLYLIDYGTTAWYTKQRL